MTFFSFNKRYQSLNYDFQAIDAKLKKCHLSLLQSKPPKILDPKCRVILSYIPSTILWFWFLTIKPMEFKTTTHIIQGEFSMDTKVLFDNYFQEQFSVF